MYSVLWFKEIIEFNKCFGGKIMLVDGDEVYKYLKEHNALLPKRFSSIKKRHDSVALLNHFKKKKAKNSTRENANGSNPYKKMLKLARTKQMQPNTILRHLFSPIRLARTHQVSEATGKQVRSCRSQGCKSAV